MPPDAFDPGDHEPGPEVGYWREFALGVASWVLGAIGLAGVLLVGSCVYGALVRGADPDAKYLALVFYGVVQLLFVVPLAAFNLARGRTARATGVLFAAGLAFSFNALCWGGVVLLLGGTRLAG